MARTAATLAVVLAFPLALAILAVPQAALAARSPAPAAPSLSLDHVNVAVKDLAEAKRCFESLGFTLKPGQPHANSIENLHAKFQDGTEIELITATEPRDSLARDYLELVGEGNGGAFVALRTPRLEEVRRCLADEGHSAIVSRTAGSRWMMFRRGDPLRFVWMQEIAKPWIDEPRHLAHANGAMGLTAVWVDSSYSWNVASFARALGREGREASSPRPRSVDVPLSNGSIQLVGVVVPVKRRPVVGVTVEVKNVSHVEYLLRAAGIPCEHRRDKRGISALVPPTEAMGIWLEFLERD